MTCSARSFGCSTSSAARRLSCCSSRPRRRVPAIGRLITLPFTQLHHRFGRGADDRRFGMTQEVHVRRRVHEPQHPVHGERIHGFDQIEPLREHHLEDVAVEDVLLRGVDRLRPSVGGEIPAQLGELDELVRGRERGHVRQRAADLGLGLVEAGRGCLVQLRELGRVPRPAAGTRSRSGSTAGGSDRTPRLGRRATAPRRRAPDRPPVRPGAARSPAPCRSRASRRCRRGTAAAARASARGSARAALRARRAHPDRTALLRSDHRRATRPPARAPPACAPASRPTNENRPQRSACSTDSSRKPSPSPTSLTNTESGVSRSASTSRQTGTTV